MNWFASCNVLTVKCRSRSSFARGLITAIAALICVSSRISVYEWMLAVAPIGFAVASRCSSVLTGLELAFLSGPVIACNSRLPMGNSLPLSFLRSAKA